MVKKTNRGKVVEVKVPRSYDTIYPRVQNINGSHLITGRFLISILLHQLFINNLTRPAPRPVLGGVD